MKKSRCSLCHRPTTLSYKGELWDGDELLAKLDQPACWDCLESSGQFVQENLARPLLSVVPKESSKKEKVKPEKSPVAYLIDRVDESGRPVVAHRVGPVRRCDLCGHPHRSHKRDCPRRGK
jgi:hypothetical protein